MTADNLDRGIALLRDALTKRPDDPKICTDLMAAWCRKETPHEAVFALLTFVKHLPDATQLHHDMLVDVGRHRGFANSLLKGFQQVGKSERGPDAFLVQYLFGLFYTALGMPNEAIPYLNDSIRLNANYGPSHHNLGLALHFSGQGEDEAEARRRTVKGIAACRTATAMDPPCIEAHYFLGVIEMNDGDPIRSVLHFHEFVKHAKPYLAGYVPQAQLSIQLLRDKIQS